MQSIIQACPAHPSGLILLTLIFKLAQIQVRVQFIQCAGYQRPGITGSYVGVRSEMISLVRSADGTIKTFSEFIDPQSVLGEGESLEVLNTAFDEFAKKLVLSHAGRSGETIVVPRSSGDLAVEVRCPGENGVSLDINGTVEMLPLIDGQAALMLGTEEAGAFVIKPADNRKYCPAGQSLLVIEVV